MPRNINLGKVDHSNCDCKQVWSDLYITEGKKITSLEEGVITDKNCNAGFDSRESCNKANDLRN